MTSVRAALDTNLSRRWVALVLVLSGALGIEVITQQPADTTGEMFRQAYDARAVFGLVAMEPSTSQRARLAALDQDISELDATFDATTGVTRTLWSRTGYLTQPQPRPAIDIADAFIASNLAILGLIDEDVRDRELTDLVFSQVTGATHVYYRQRHGGIPVYATQLQVHVNREGRILGVNNSFLPAIATAVNATVPAIEARTGVQVAFGHLKMADSMASARPEMARLMFLPIQKGVARLVWNFQIAVTDGSHAYDFTVDAESGQVWTRYDRVWAEQYKVYPQPVESPIHVSTRPPRDGRSTILTPADAVASPLGWHDTDGLPGAESTLMVGNNVHAYVDSARANQPPAIQPDCGLLIVCLFPLALTQTPSVYSAAAVANLFYWNNIVHDVQYRYGFDEAGGNFQVNNYERGGALALGNDSMQAEAQDSLMLNNASIYVPPDGQRPRMQMFLWTHTEPARDSTLDSGVIVHEYGHGISARQVGGPSNVDCLRNSQQPGEGLSDWLALVYTAQASDTAGMPRGAATYLLGQPTTGPGVRGMPYSADPAVNNWTYESIAGKAVPHGVGAVWAQGMWRVYWALVDRHGFSTDLYGVHGTAGNQRAMLYVNEGMKNVVCNPTFTDMRDAIIQSAVDNYGGADVCLMWTAFAAFGLGVDAISHGPSSTSPVNGYGVPEACVTSPPEASTPFYPLEHVGERRQEFGWKYVANASWYQLWITDATGVRIQTWYPASSVKCWNAEAVCRTTPDIDLNPGIGWWWVRTWNGAGYGPWSPGGTFFAGPPIPPSLWAPWGQIDTVLPTYSWYPSVSATWYRLWVDDAAGHRFDHWYPESALFCYPPQSLCRITPAVALHPGAANFWIQAWNAFGASPWSAPSSFTVPQTVTVEAVYPVRGAMPGATVRLWALVKNDTAQPLSAQDAVRFELNLSQQIVGSTSVAGLAPGASQWYAFDWTLAADVVGGTYGYRAQVWDGIAARSLPSIWQDFTVGFDSQFNGGSIAPWKSRGGIWTIEDDAYLAAPGQRDQWFGVSYGDGGIHFGDVDFTVRMRRDGCATCANEIMLRSIVGAGFATGYAFQYTADGHFAVYAHFYDSSAVLKASTFSPAIQPGPVWNVFRVVARGGERASFHFYINGELVWSGEHQDPSLNVGVSGVRFYSDGKLWIDYATLRDVPAAIAGLSAGAVPCASNGHVIQCEPR